MEEKKSIGMVKIQENSLAGPRLLQCRGLGLTEEKEASKSLYICSFERHKSDKIWGAYVVRAVNLSDLLSSSNDSLELGQLGYRAGEELPANGGCGVLGSKIVFASGLKRNLNRNSRSTGPPYGPDSSTEAYVFDTNDPKHEIIRMDGTLHQGKHVPLVVEVAGKLYALSGKPFGRSFNSFEVFDPTEGSWSLLPEFPKSGYVFSYAIAGTKFFVSNEKMPVCCFDVADPNQQEWRAVPSMWGGNPFPFRGKALVLDLPEPEHHNKKIMFTAENYGDDGRQSRLLVYLMSLYENQETITPIHALNLLQLPQLPAKPSDYYFFHLGDHNACLVIPDYIFPYEDRPYKPEAQTIQGTFIPFQFEFDISKVDQDKKNCFTVQFMPPRILEYHTNPSCLPRRETVGCFVL